LPLLFYAMLRCASSSGPHGQLRSSVPCRRQQQQHNKRVSCLVVVCANMVAWFVTNQVGCERTGRLNWCLNCCEVEWWLQEGLLLWWWWCMEGGGGAHVLSLWWLVDESRRDAVVWNCGAQHGPLYCILQ
jgi:hypothetical protein